MQESRIYFNHSREAERFILLQLTPELLGKKLCIKAASASSSVLCTEDATYQLKDVQQSNSLMFLSSGDRAADQSLELQGQSASWLEITAIRKPVISLSNLPVFDGESEVIGVPGDVLFSDIPASEQEILVALRREMCLELNSGYVRLKSSYVLRLAHILVNSLVAFGIDLAKIEEQDFLSSIADEDENAEVLSFLLRRFSLIQSAPYHLDTKELVRYAGLHTLLTTVSKAPSSIDTFNTRWRQATPVQFHHHCQDLILLQGLYIHPVVTQIRYFSTSDLSIDPKLRINELLNAKDRWAESEMVPFLVDICADAKAAQSVIMKFARKVKVGKTNFVERRVK